MHHRLHFSVPAINKRSSNSGLFGQSGAGFSFFAEKANCLYFRFLMEAVFIL